MQDHPENIPPRPSDRHNRPRPEPQSIAELATAPDPLEMERRNRASTRQAIIYAAATLVVSFGVGFLLALVARLQGGPLCDAGAATWLCTQQWRTGWAIGSSIAPVAMMLGCAVIMVRKLNRYERWVPWMGVFWIPIVPFTMWWLTITVGILAIDSI